MNSTPRLIARDETPHALEEAFAEMKLVPGRFLLQPIGGDVGLRSGLANSLSDMTEGAPCLLAATDWFAFRSNQIECLPEAIRAIRHERPGPVWEFSAEWFVMGDHYSRALLGVFAYSFFDFFFLCPEKDLAYAFSNDEEFVALNAISEKRMPRGPYRRRRVDTTNVLQRAEPDYYAP